MPCSCGSVYIAETKLLVSTIIKEHIRHSKNQDIEKSSVAEHSALTNHWSLFHKNKVLASYNFCSDIKMIYTIEIDDNFDKDDGVEISRTWGPVLRALQAKPVGSRPACTYVTPATLYKTLKLTRPSVLDNH